jgi:hypothetical protein
MRIFIRATFLLVIAAAIGVVGMAVVSDLPAPTAEVSVPVAPM